MDTCTLVPALHDYEHAYEDSMWMHGETACYMLYTQREVYPHESSSDSALCSD